MWSKFLLFDILVFTSDNNILIVILFLLTSMHLQYLQDSNARCIRDATFLWSMHTQSFD